LLSRQTGRSALVMGMGNISGPGMEMVEYFRRRNVAAASRTCHLQEAA
jgi:hypothetical protein